MNTNAPNEAGGLDSDPPPSSGESSPTSTLDRRDGRPPVRPPNVIARELVTGVVAVGFLFDRAVFSGSMNSVGWALLFSAASLLMFLTGAARTIESRLAVGGAVFFAVMLAIRTEPRLVVFNYLAILTMWFVITVFGRADRSRRLFHYRPSQSVADAGRIFSNCFVSVSEGLTETSARSQRRSEAVPGTEGRRESVLRGVLIAGPIVALLWLLLSSADLVFDSMYRIDTSRFAPLGLHFVPSLIGALVVAGVLFVAGRGGAEVTSYVTPKLGSTEVGIVLGAINVLYAMFAVSQAVALSGVGERIITDAGMTFKEYARHGFFQLLWVAGITLLILIVANTVTASAEAKERRVLRGLSYITVVLTLILVGVAIRRLALYIGDNGLTPLRFYSSVFSVWVGVAFGIVGVWVARKSVTSAWLMPALVLSGLIVLAGLNVANPEAVIAQTNIDRDEGSLVFHMDKQTEDGDAVLAANIDQLNPELASAVSAKLCYGFDAEASDGFWGWNLGRASAQSALESLCG